MLQANQTRLESTQLSITTPTEEFRILDVFQSKPPPSKKRKAVKHSDLGGKKEQNGGGTCRCLGAGGVPRGVPGPGGQLHGAGQLQGLAGLQGLPGL